MRLYTKRNHAVVAVPRPGWTSRKALAKKYFTYEMNEPCSQLCHEIIAVRFVAYAAGRNDKAL
jgi:hypothetical protein